MTVSIKERHNEAAGVCKKAHDKSLICEVAMKLTIEIDFPDTDKCSTARVRIMSPNNRIVLTDDSEDGAYTAEKTEQVETEFDDVRFSTRLLLIALALFSPVAVPILCYLAWLYFTESLQKMTVADIWGWVAPLYFMVAGLLIIATPLIEYSVIWLYRTLRGIVAK